MSSFALSSLRRAWVSIASFFFFLHVLSGTFAQQQEPPQTCNPDVYNGCFSYEMLRAWVRFSGDTKSQPLMDELWNAMNSCFARTSTADMNLWEVSDKFWEAFVDFGIQKRIGKRSDGNRDFWGPLPTFLEEDPTPLVTVEDMQADVFPNLPANASQVTIYEPCNTLSNIAAIRMMLEFCNYGIENTWTLNEGYVLALVRAATALWPSSSLFHAGGGALGWRTDTQTTNLLPMIFLQGALQDIPYEPVLHDVSNTPANYTAEEAARVTNLIYMNESYVNWRRMVDNMNILRNELSLMALFSVALNLVFPERCATMIVSCAAGLVINNNESVAFVTGTFVPRLRQVLFEERQLCPSLATRLILLSQFVGCLLKYTIAIIWQENRIKFPAFRMNCSLWNAFAGTVTIPVINLVSNSLTGFGRAEVDPEFQQSCNVYPGDRKCSNSQPHSKWHEISMNGLVDLALYANSMARVIRGLPAAFSQRGRKTFDEHESNDTRDDTTNNDNIGLVECLQEERAFAAFEEEPLSQGLVDVLNTCAATLLETQQQSDEESFSTADVGVILECLVYQILRMANTNATTTATTDANSNVDIPEEIATTLDQCLVEHECIGFEDLQFDVDRLKTCIGLGGEWYGTMVQSILGGSSNSKGNNSPCSSYIGHRFRLSYCGLGCGRHDSLCWIGCLVRHAQMSEWLVTAASCLEHMSHPVSHPDDDDATATYSYVLPDMCSPSVASQSQLRQQPQHEMPQESWNSFQTEIVRGLSDLTSSSRGRCRTQAIEFQRTYRRLKRLLGRWA